MFSVMFNQQFNIALLSVFLTVLEYLLFVTDQGFITAGHFVHSSGPVDRLGKLVIDIDLLFEKLHLKLHPQEAMTQA